MAKKRHPSRHERDLAMLRQNNLEKAQKLAEKMAQPIWDATAEACVAEHFYSLQFSARPHESIFTPRPLLPDEPIYTKKGREITNERYRSLVGMIAENQSEEADNLLKSLSDQEARENFDLIAGAIIEGLRRTHDFSRKERR